MAAGRRLVGTDCSATPESGLAADVLGNDSESLWFLYTNARQNVLKPNKGIKRLTFGQPVGALGRE